MSQSPLAGTGAEAEYFRNWDALGAMIARGRSFSGHERDCCFLNPAGRSPRFATVSSAVALDHADDGRGIALGDWDGDGDTDIWTSCRSAPRVRFLRNDFPSTNQWITLRLEGRTCNRDAIGARVELTVREAGKTAVLIQTVRAGHSFVSQSSKELLFGLGKAELVSAAVRWPGQREPEAFHGLKPGSRWRLVQSTGSAAAVSLPASAPLAAGPAVLPVDEPPVHIFLTKPQPLPKTGWLDLAQSPKPLETKNRPLLLVLWATWCAPCARELKALAAEKAALGGIDVLALNIDGIGSEGEGADPAKIKAFLKTVAWPETWTAGIAPVGLMRQLTAAHHRAIYLERDPPLPSSWLLNAAGEVAAIYLGPVTPARLAADAARINGPKDDLKSTAFPFPGKSATAVLRADLNAMAQAYLDAGYHSDAIELLKTTLSNPAASAEARAEAHYLSGFACTAAGSHSGAAAAFKEALGLTPQKPGLAAALAQALHRAGKSGEAAEAMRRETQSSTPEAHARAAQAWLEAGDAAAALASFDAALKLSPGSPVLEFGRASALEKLPGRAAEAIAAYRRLLKLPEAANNLAWILSTHPSASLRAPAASLQLAAKLAALTARQNPGVLDTLAAATAASGDFPAAARIAAEARTLALATGQFSLARDLATRITVYQAGKAFIAPAYR